MIVFQSFNNLIIYDSGSIIIVVYMLLSSKWTRAATAEFVSLISRVSENKKARQHHPHKISTLWAVMLFVASGLRTNPPFRLSQSLTFACPLRVNLSPIVVNCRLILLLSPCSPKPLRVKTLIVSVAVAVSRAGGLELPASITSGQLISDGRLALTNKVLDRPVTETLSIRCSA